MKNRLAIVILGGGLHQDLNGIWHTIDFGVNDIRMGKMADRARVIAATYLYLDHPGSIIISSGGRGQLAEVLPEGLTISRVIKDELIELGVPAGVILEEDRSSSTYKQLLFLIEAIKGYSMDRIILLSNRYHTPRISAMIEHAPGLNSLHSQHIEVVAAEDVMLKFEPEKWQKKIEDFYSDPDTKKRIALEENGVDQIRAGNYKYS